MIKNIVSNYNMSTALKIIGYILLGSAIGIALLITPLLPMFAFLFAIAVLVFSVYKPELSIITIVVLLASIVYEEKLPLIPIGVGSLHITDVLLLFLFIQAAIKRFSASNTKNSPLEKVLALFLILAMMSAFISISYLGANFNTVFRTFRVLSYYLLFFIITNLITTRKQMRFLVTALLAVAALVGVTILLQAIVGDSIELMPGRLVKATALDVKFDAIRILPPGQTLIYISFVIAVCLAVFHRDKPILLSRFFYLILILGIGITLTYTRSYWIGIILSMVVFMMLVTADERKRLTALIASGAALAALVVLISWGDGGRLGNTLNAVSERYFTLFAGKDLIKSSSLQDRYLENQYAVKQIMQHPVLGIGLGNDYRPTIYGPKDNLTYYVHNAYLWIMLDMGIPGFVLLMWFYAGFLIRALKHLKDTTDSFRKPVILGSLLAGIGIIPMALTIPLFMEWHSIVAMVTFMGLSETMIINYEPRTDEAQPSPLSQ